MNPERIIYSDHWYGYNGLVDMSCKKHYRIRHGNNGFVNSKILIGLNYCGHMKK